MDWQAHRSECSCLILQIDNVEVGGALAHPPQAEPYFDEPFYVGYNVGGFELGLVPDETPGADGAVAYWGVTDCAAALQRLIQIGAPVKEPVQDVGGGIKVAAVLDPFGNTFGIIENPHFNPTEVR